MKKSVETQVAAFDQVLGHCNALGEMYNPGKESLQVNALTSLLTSARESVKAFDKAKSHLVLMVNDRQDKFAPLPFIATRIVHSLTAADAPPSLIADIKLYRDKFRSKARASQAPKVPPDGSVQVQPDSAAGSDPRGPISQLDYNTKIRNFGMMIDMLQNCGADVLASENISLGKLTCMLQSLEESHQAVADAKQALSKARMDRNKLLYGENGIYGVTKRVKKFISSVYGPTSVESRKVYKIQINKK